MLGPGILRRCRPLEIKVAETIARYANQFPTQVPEATQDALEHEPLPTFWKLRCWQNLPFS